MKPNFGEDGELLGFEIRSELIELMFYNSDFNHNFLKRAVKTVCMLNRLLQRGKYEDLNLI
jgi:hypothetical protein